MDKPEGYEGDIDGTIRRRRSNNNDKNSSSPKTVNQALTPVIRVMGWGLGLILVYAGFANMFWDDTSNSTIPYLLAGIFFLTISSARCKKFSASDMFVLSAFIVGLAMMAYAFHELWWPGESLNPILFYYFIGGLFIAVVGGIVGAVGSKHDSNGHEDNYGWGYGYRRRWW